MPQKQTGVLSPAGDALLLAALFLPFAPIVATLYTYMIGLALSCTADTVQSCGIAGLDFNSLHARAADMMKWTAQASAGGALLIYLLLLAGLAQFTTQGFRGRVVRTCAVTMWAGVMPLVLALASVSAHAPERLCGNRPCDAHAMISSFAFFGNVLFDWLANIAVPLAVLVTGLLVLTLGYRALVGHVVRLATKRD